MKAITSKLVAEIQTEIVEFFKLQEFVFSWSNEYGMYVGQTTPAPSGAYIKIKQYLNSDEFMIMIELLHADPDGATDPYDIKARRTIHEHIMMELIYNRRSPDSGHFLRQDLLALKKVGIEQVVASLVRLHQQYDKIWASLESRGIREQIATALTLFAENEKRVKKSIDVVIGENFPTPTESTEVSQQS